MSYLLRLEREYSQQRSHIQGLKPSPSLTGFLYSFWTGEAHEMCEAKMLGCMCSKAPQDMFRCQRLKRDESKIH
jgi:hypothetical protein